MSSIGDTKVLKVNDDDVAYPALDVKLGTVLLARYYCLSFLAERGELTTAEL